MTDERLGELSSLLLVAEGAVDTGIDVMKRGRGHVRALIDKGDYGFATVIDVQVQNVLRAHLSEHTPGIPFFGEEEAGEIPLADEIWLLDPIDGTSNYVDGSPLCAISLALVRRGRPVLGIVAAPLLGERFVAVRGAGALHNGVPMQVARREVGDKLVALSDFAFGHKHRETNQLRFAMIEELVRHSMKLRIHGSVALDLAWLAAGRLSAAIALSNRPWDVAAGVLMVEEAGGEVFDENGAAYTMESASVLGTTPALRQDILSIVTTAGEQVAAAG